jgi:hypothetical protein
MKTASEMVEEMYIKTLGQKSLLAEKEIKLAN